MSQPTDPVQQFFSERRADMDAMALDDELRRKSFEWMVHADKYRYTLNFTWMGRPIIKLPADVMILQEMIWSLKPDLIIETGIAHGGSIIFMASLLELLGGDREVVAVDIDIRAHNRQEIEGSPMMKRITMFEGSSTDPAIFEKIKAKAENRKCVLVVLDSSHTHEHVYNELKLYSELVTLNSYLIATDTFVEFFPKGHFQPHRPWDVGDNPYTATMQFLKERDDFVVDSHLTHKALITETIDGYLKRVKPPAALA